MATCARDRADGEQYHLGRTRSTWGIGTFFPRPTAGGSCRSGVSRRRCVAVPRRGRWYAAVWLLADGRSCGARPGPGDGKGRDGAPHGRARRGLQRLPDHRGRRRRRAGLRVVPSAVPDVVPADRRLWRRRRDLRPVERFVEDRARHGAWAACAGADGRRADVGAERRIRRGDGFLRIGRRLS